MAKPRIVLPAALIGLATLLLTAAPAGAIDVPQTREEFVRVVAEGARGVKMETLVVERSFDEVYKTLESRTSPCLDIEVQRTAYVGYVERSSSDYNPALKRLGADRAEFTLQVVNRPRGVGHTPPPGGLYILAADFKRAGPSRTEVVLYRPTIGFKDITKSLMQWAEGSDTDCPKLK
ncbi:MAG TPA: hypothetical protein VFG76_12345 [Candidatus Polarisedimenticolia bacterium]|nr:hypothetical protein [Candidatus Polarisedimenticolia bacterium]